MQNRIATYLFAYLHNVGDSPIINLSLCLLDNSAFYETKRLEIFVLLDWIRCIFGKRYRNILYFKFVNFQSIYELYSQINKGVSVTEFTA